VLPVAAAFTGLVVFVRAMDPEAVFATAPFDLALILESTVHAFS
jgi:hypothetical protein